MIDCPCGFGKNIRPEKRNCHVCGLDLTPLFRVRCLPDHFELLGQRALDRGDRRGAAECFAAAVALGSPSARMRIEIGRFPVVKEGAMFFESPAPESAERHKKEKRRRRNRNRKKKRKVDR